MSLPAEIASYVQTLMLGQGRRAGLAFELMPWQGRFPRGAFSQIGDAALNMGRGGGKTTFVGSIVARLYCISVNSIIIKDLRWFSPLPSPH